jgi:dephospho-CoA kinase
VKRTRPLRIALTGGIASGKTAVAERFAARGIPVIDADDIAHEVVTPGRPALRQVVEAFGPGVLDSRGALDRRRLRALIFAQPGQRQRLEAILHPVIIKEMLRRSTSADGPYQLLVIPLLAESAREVDVDRVLVVDSPLELQVQRLLARDAETESQARAMIATQATREERLALADDVILNDGDLAALDSAVAALDTKYRRLSQAESGR